MSIRKFLKMKKKQEKIVMITAYDYFSAKIAEAANVDMILVGDSASNVMLGNNDTIKIGMEEMIIFVKAVKKGAPNTFIIGDMPFLSYQVSDSEAIKNAGLLLKAGADAIKLEGGLNVVPLIKKMVDFGIPVMGHIGFTPQSYKQIGITSKGKTQTEEEVLLNSAKALENSGAFSIVLEMVTEPVAKKISEELAIPTIGIGSGRFCDGQVLVWHDLLGLNNEFEPKFLKKYLNGFELFKEAIENYSSEVKNGKFPEAKHAYKPIEEGSDQKL
ncbi:3-methyl-2-oxobutanoate hydroxymethyltransferase [Marinitoga piezophila KA3]|uniref:3-methyl-2-oxobutanoate hydroxymethyltransferase n=1 Tax=Marinitoga piezophila (strain DSM 14283 / JCM 11233 / KA3) TaxID=443254 RepID=H2J7Z9_MARPK|nr:3-methyl-2-oxobutanoate hydroxymethyltransferase [Marinitoga piezophila]AEX85490.1 3-methyl-2-oxobutanoate hydroxymethyltransferase [Marinitoga piezophila KA3]